MQHAAQARLHHPSKQSKPKALAQLSAQTPPNRSSPLPGFPLKSLKSLVPDEGIEPQTFGLQNRTDRMTMPVNG
jgi:hypothetical protein